MSEISCEDVLRHLNSAFDGEELGVELEESVAAHLDDCVSCARAAREMSSTHRLMLELVAKQIDSRKTGATQPAAAIERRRTSSRVKIRPARRNSPSNANVWWLAASAAAALVLLVLIANSGKNNTVAQPHPRPNPETPRNDSPALAEKRRAAQDEFARADQQRKRALSELVELERRRDHIDTPTNSTAQPPDKISAEEKERLDALAQLDAKRHDVEVELERAQNAQDRAHDELARVDGKSAMPAPAPITTPAGPKPLGQITQLGNNLDARIERAGKQVMLSPGEVLLPGDRVVTGKGPASPRVDVSLALFAGATVDLASETSIEISDADSCRLIAGRIYADVAKDPSAKTTGYRWTVKTAAADVGITGTRFSVSASTDQTQLQMEEGSVEFFNTHGKQRVSALQESVATAGVIPGAPVAIQLSAIWRGHNDIARAEVSDEIVLSAPQARLIGDDWQYVRDENASAQLVLESPKLQTRGARELTRDISKFTSFAVFSFKAEANRDYFIWVRGYAPSSKDPWKHDAVILFAPDSTMTEPEGPFKGNAGRGDASLFNGYSFEQGYWWVGGDSDRAADKLPPDTTPVSVRFNKSGEQLLKVFAVETPMRIDSIWISTTQKTRPEASRHGPLKTAK